MLKDIAHKYYFEQNYNCAESVLRAANEQYELGLHDRDMILVGGFGAGVQTGNACGAMLGAVSVLSMRYVAQKAHESAEIKPMVTAFTERFTAALGASTMCCDLKPIHFVPEVRCVKIVDTACDILEEMLSCDKGGLA